MILIRFHLFLTIILYVQVSGFAQSAKEDIIITSVPDNIPVTDFFKNIEKSGGVFFFYRHEWIDSLKLVYKGGPLTLIDFLNRSLNEYGLSVFRMDSLHYILTRDYKIVPSVRIDYRDEQREHKVSVAGSDFLGRESLAEEGSTENGHLVIVGRQLAPGTKGEAEITGYVRDRKTGEPIIGATVYVNELGTGCVTDPYGRYRLVIDPGRYMLVFRYVGMKEISQPVLLQSDGRVDINMEEKLYRLRELVVEGEKSDNITGTQMSLATIPIRTIREIPVVLGEADIIKVVLTLPGVQTVGEGANGFNVRGGAADQNLIILDDAPVYNTSHLFGFFSVFNTDVIKEFELYKSGIPPAFGGRLSSIFDIRTKDGNKLKFGGSGGISPVTARFMFEGPIKKGESSFLIAGRSTYSDWILRQLKDPDLRNSNASFYDINAKFNYEINEKNNLTIAGYHSQDNFTLASQTNYAYDNTSATVRWNYRLTEKLFAACTGILSSYHYQISSFEKNINSYRMRFGIGQREIKASLSWYPDSYHKVDAGLGSTWYTLEPCSYYPDGDQSKVSGLILDRENAVETAAYISDKYNITPDFSVYGGLRLSSFLVLGPRTVYEYEKNRPRELIYLNDSAAYAPGRIIKAYAGLEPRLLVRYVLGPGSSLKASYNRMRQYVQMLSNTTAISPTDTWKLSDTHIPPQMADQVSIGYYRNFRKNTIEVSAELYYKAIRNMTEYKPGAELLLNKHIETDLINGKGEAYGMEFMVKKDHGRFNGWISYTYARSLLKVTGSFPGEAINKGAFYPALYDKPHDATLVANYKFSRRLSFSSIVTYSTGRPVTYPAAKFYYKDVTRLYYSMRNEYRIPDYFRWDMSINVEGNLRVKKPLHSSWSLSVYNATGRKNAYSVFFINENGEVNGYRLSVFAQPIYTLTYNFRF